MTAVLLLTAGAWAAWATWAATWASAVSAASAAGAARTVAAASSSAAAAASVTATKCSNPHAGLQYCVYEFTSPKARVHVLTVARNSALDIVVGTPYKRIGGARVLSSMARDYGAVAAVNGTFFNLLGGLPQPAGYIVSQGRLTYKAGHSDVSLGIRWDGSVRIGAFRPAMQLILPGGESVPINHVNIAARQDGVALITEDYRYMGFSDLYLPLQPLGGDTYRPGTPMVVMGSSLPATPGLLLRNRATLADKLQASHSVAIRQDFTPAWTGLRTLISGGPHLVAQGRPAYPQTEQAYIKMAGRNPRTAIGVDSGGNIKLCVLEGRMSSSPGMTLPEWSAALARLGLYEAMGLDGGDSTEMWIKGDIVSRLSGGLERPVSTAIMVVPK